MFDFAPTRALRQLSEYGIGLSPNEPNPENAVRDLVSFLPVLAYDGANMTQIDAGGILDIAMAGTSATLLARKWESALLVNVDNDTLRRVLDNSEAMAAVSLRRETAPILAMMASSSTTMAVSSTKQESAKERLS